MILAILYPDALISIKPKLAESRLSNPKTISDELYTVASLAESFSQKRPRANKDWSTLADVLDREGVLFRGPQVLT